MAIKSRINYAILVFDYPCFDSTFLKGLRRVTINNILHETIQKLTILLLKRTISYPDGIPFFLYLFVTTLTDTLNIKTPTPSTLTNKNVLKT